MFKRILIPTDATEFGRNALEQGLEVARLMGSEVTILYALENPYGLAPAYSAEPPEQIERALERYRRESEKALAQIKEIAAAQGVSARAVLVEDSPVSAILEAAKEHDLVVMATHGRKGIERVLMGSVTDKVLHNCSTPVLVLRGSSA
ncbi:universal stress protein [Calidithermus timidus]|jgi:nucleotide-binding universal stress UspA family protein|uniref:universal stress protein n=1 Tax=Calidithermus timidus TaxID=307124 RepID=UPI00035D9165|nr:universal stress protein [Calidithermus timidus]